MNDLISRQAAIDAIKTWGLLDGLSEGEAIEILSDEEKLPSAQSEIIRCKDCMWWDTSWKPTWAIGEEHWCSSNDTFMWPKDYCSKAERIES